MPYVSNVPYVVNDPKWTKWTTIAELWKARMFAWLVVVEEQFDTHNMHMKMQSDV